MGEDFRVIKDGRHMLIIAFLNVLAGVSAWESPDVAPLCSDASIPPTPVTCSATIDVLLVVDASSSLQDIHDEMTTFMHAFAESFTFDTTRPAETPRFGVVTFNGPPIGSTNDFDADDAAEILLPLTSDINFITSTLNARPASNGLTCITCGLQKAQAVLNSPSRRAAPGYMVIITDGRQTVGGDMYDVRDTAITVRDDGYTLLTIGFGDAERQTMEWIASSPSESYALDAYGLTSASGQHVLEPNSDSSESLLCVPTAGAPLALASPPPRS